jgi:hypothetical protein
VKVKLYTEDSLKAVFKMYFLGWLDVEYRENVGLNKNECAYYTLAYAEEISRYLGTQVDFSVISIDDIQKMIHDGLKYSNSNNLLKRAEQAVGDVEIDRNEYMETLQDLVWERNRLQCFLNQASSFIDLDKDGTIQTELALETVASLRFDHLFLEENTLLAAELASENQWYLAEAATVPLPNKNWWFYRHLGSRKNTSGRIMSADPATFFAENVFYLSKIASKARLVTENTTPVEFSFPILAAAFIGVLPMGAADSRRHITRIAVIDSSKTDLHFPIKAVTGTSFEPKELYCMLETPIFRSDDGRTKAQWKVKGKAVPSFHNSKFFLTEINSGEILGSGIVAEDHFATLQAGNWERLQKYTEDVSNLLLICLL